MFSEPCEGCICSINSVLLLIDKEIEVTDPCIFGASHRKISEEHCVSESLIIVLQDSFHSWVSVALGTQVLPCAFLTSYFLCFKTLY